MQQRVATQPFTIMRLLLVRRGLCDAIEAATERELVEQDWLRHTEDFKEGIKAMADRRLPNFQGR